MPSHVCCQRARRLGPRSDGPGGELRAQDTSRRPRTLPWVSKQVQKQPPPGSEVYSRPLTSPAGRWAGGRLHSTQGPHGLRFRVRKGFTKDLPHTPSPQRPPSSHAQKVVTRFCCECVPQCLRSHEATRPR